MSEKMKPCPFCGASAKVTDYKARVAELEREVEHVRERLATERMRHEASIAPILQSASEAVAMRPLVIHIDPALAPRAEVKP